MSHPVGQLSLQVQGGAWLEADELEELTRQLRRELADLDVDSVELVRAGEPPPGARAVDVLAVGSLLVTLARSSGVLAAVVGAIQSWVAGPRQRTVKLELDGDTLEVTGLTSADQRRLITTWIARHSDPGT
jgi:hypothetical protein